MTWHAGQAARAIAVRGRRAIRRRREPHGLILGYHRVATDRVDPWQLCVSPEHFAQQLEILAGAADIVPLEELHERLATRSGKRPVAAVTFDDGYADNLLAALPVLERLGVPATIFICTGVTGKASFWWDRLAAIVFHPESLSSGVDIEEIGFRWRGGTSPADRESLHLELWRALQGIEDDRRDDILDRLADTNDGPADEQSGARPMSADEVAALAESPLIEIGAHSLTHRPLSELSRAVQLDEIERSARDCEKMTGVRPRSFAYPFGDTTAQIAELAHRAGFARACSQRPDLVWRDSDPYQLPRVGALDQDAAGFARRLRREWLP